MCKAAALVSPQVRIGCCLWPVLSFSQCFLQRELFYGGHQSAQVQRAQGGHSGWLRTREEEIWCERQNPQFVHFRALPLLLCGSRKEDGMFPGMWNSPEVPRAIKSPVSAASMEERQLQRFHFHLDFKQLYKRASILVTLILFLVGLDGDCIRLSAHRGWKAGVCVCVCVCVCVFLNIFFIYSLVRLGLQGNWKGIFTA